MPTEDPYVKAFAGSLCCDTCGAVNGCTCADARIERVAEMFGQVTLLRRAEVMARRDLGLVELDVPDRLRQQADAWVAAIRRGDDEPLTCESPRIPQEALALYMQPVIEHFEAELEEARQAARGQS